MRVSGPMCWYLVHLHSMYIQSLLNTVMSIRLFNTVVHHSLVIYLPPLSGPAALYLSSSLVAFPLFYPRYLVRKHDKKPIETEPFL